MADEQNVSAELIERLITRIEALEKRLDEKETKEKETKDSKESKGEKDTKEKPKSTGLLCLRRPKPFVILPCKSMQKKQAFEIASVETLIPGPCKRVEAPPHCEQKVLDSKRLLFARPWVNDDV